VKALTHLPAGILSTVLVVGGAVAAAAPQTPKNATVYAKGLEGPRGLRFGGDGFLYVAEAGLGGKHGTGSACRQVPQPVGPYTGGKTARISRVGPDGKVSTVASGFPSAQDALGDILGVNDVAFLNGELYAVLAGGGCSHGNGNIPNGVVQVDRKTGEWKLIANLSAFLKQHQAKVESPDDFEPDGTFYSLLTVDGLLYTVEPNHGQIFSVSPGGTIEQLIDISASEGHVVPTSIDTLDGRLYVGTLNTFPIDPKWARVLTLTKTSYDDPAPGFDNDGFAYDIKNSKAGFTTVVAVDFGPDGLLYALELSSKPGFPTPGAGKVVRVARDGTIETVVAGLTVPTGMTFGPDNRLYISNFGAAPPGAGQILQFDVPPG